MKMSAVEPDADWYIRNDGVICAEYAPGQSASLDFIEANGLLPHLEVERIRAAAAKSRREKIHAVS